MINIQVVKINTKKEFERVRTDIIGELDKKRNDRFWKLSFLGFVHPNAPNFVFLSEKRIRQNLRRIFSDEKIVDKDAMKAYSLVATSLITYHELGHTAGILRNTIREYDFIDQETSYYVEEYIANEIGYDHIEKVFGKKLLSEFKIELDNAWCSFVIRNDDSNHYYFRKRVEKLPKGIQRDIKFEISERKKLIKEFNLVY